MRPPDRRVLLALLILALASRLVWALWIHPTTDYVFRDMKGYIDNARWLVEHPLTPHHWLAFQAWGTHTLLALPLAIFGVHDLLPAAILWACFAAAAVPLIYLLACRVCTRPWLPPLVGVAALLWYPNLVNSGLFLAEAPLLCFLTAATWRLVVLLQDGRGALGCGLLAAVCIALRPETLIFFTLALLLWLRVRRDHPAARWRHVGLVTLPVALVLAFSSWHFHHHTGSYKGISESAYINLTLARCQSARVQGYHTDDEFERDRGILLRAIGTPSFLGRSMDPRDHWLAVRPVFGTTPATFEIPAFGYPLVIRIARHGHSIQFVGDAHRPRVHTALVRACFARAGLAGQLRISASNLVGLWFFNSQWPDNSEKGEPWLPWSDAFVTVFQIIVLLPCLLGIAVALRTTRRNPGLALCTLPLLSSMLTASIWFGDIRLRTPYDPLALLLAAETYARAATALRGAARRRLRPPDPTPPIR